MFFKLQTKATLPDALSVFVYTVVWETIYAYHMSGPLTPKVIIEGIGKIENHQLSNDEKKTDNVSCTFDWVD